MSFIDKDILEIQNRKWDDVKKNYNEFKTELLKLDTHSNMVSSISDFRNDKLDKNEQNLMKIDKDLNTLRRQVEISQNSSLQKEDWIYVLRGFFVYLAVMYILIFALRNHPYFPWISAIVSLFALFFVGSRLWSFYNRDPMRWTVRKWAHTKKYDMAPEEDECLADEDEGMNIADLADKNALLAEISKLRNSETQAQDGQKRLMDRETELLARKKQVEEIIKNLKETS